jgi:hypothetical protein
LIEIDGASMNGRATAGVADGGDRLAVGIEVAQRVGAGARGFAEHVVGVAVAGLFGSARALQRLVILRPMTNCLPRMRIAVITACRITGSPARETRRLRMPLRLRCAVVEIDDAAGEHQGPGAGIDEGAVRGAESSLPLGAADLVANQAIDGCRVGDAQQRFGEAHQHHPLARDYFFT